ncbi:hypothetical protein [Streptomyces vietnamensis]|uniref:Uncharacterized protein n=1 Tax=Streptomyces vietnamensis TaxID=362257 RepID=A0A0B5ILA8_9ACTN|nr:hypothetical protein [Streptomyces vietnamensis]AJF70418.1 hypothetical protein SVTN_40260 [Streptomyces vietnamensis]
MFELKLPVETLEVRGPLFAAGVVWLRLGGTDFPESGWHDSPLSVFGSLHTAVQEVLKGETRDAYFFDGSYFVKMIPVAATSGSPRLVRIAGVCDSDEANPAVVTDITAPLRGVVESLNSVLQSLRAWAADEGDAEIQAMLLAMPDLPEPVAPAPMSPC